MVLPVSSSCSRSVARAFSHAGRLQRKKLIHCCASQGRAIGTASGCDYLGSRTNEAAACSFADPQLARHVAAIGAGVVAVHGRHGPPFSGFVWRRGAIVTAEEALAHSRRVRAAMPAQRRDGAIRRRTWRCSGSPSVRRNSRLVSIRGIGARIAGQPREVWPQCLRISPPPAHHSPHRPFSPPGDADPAPSIRFILASTSWRRSDLGCVSLSSSRAAMTSLK